MSHAQKACKFQHFPKNYFEPCIAHLNKVGHPKTIIKHTAEMSVACVAWWFGDKAWGVTNPSSQAAQPKKSDHTKPR
jgi:hypothetical protein